MALDPTPQTNLCGTYAHGVEHGPFLSNDRGSPGISFRMAGVREYPFGHCCGARSAIVVNHRSADDYYYHGQFLSVIEKILEKGLASNGLLIMVFGSCIQDGFVCRDIAN